jgi:hypothetical protein
MDALNRVEHFIVDNIEISREGIMLRVGYGFDLEGNEVTFSVPLESTVEKPPSVAEERSDGCPF